MKRNKMFFGTQITLSTPNSLNPRLKVYIALGYKIEGFTFFKLQYDSAQIHVYDSVYHLNLLPIVTVSGKK